MDNFWVSLREPINSATKTKFQSDLDNSEDATRQESLSQESRKTVGCRKEREKKREWFVKRRTRWVLCSKKERAGMEEGFVC